MPPTGGGDTMNKTEVVRLLQNSDILAINQDVLGVQGRRLISTTTADSTVEVRYSCLLLWLVGTFV
jgi:hypothetical protein